jgi:DNA-binding NarL/FixJ family response regulator
VGVEGRPQRTAVVHDPHPLWLDAVRSVLDRVDVSVAAATSDRAQARELVRSVDADLLVTADPSLVLELGSEAPRAVVLGDSGDPAAVAAALAAGASAYVVRTAHADDLATAVRQVFARTLYTVVPAAPPSGRDRTDAAVLTRREQEILALVAEGRSNAEVAALLWVSRQTVKFHLGGVYRKLGVANRTEAARWAYERGLTARRPALAA